MNVRSGYRLLALALLARVWLLADGGTLILQKQAGPLTISIFSSPEPLRTGPGDLSVMVQRSADKSSILDADVKLHLTQANPNGIMEVFSPATHANATNKLLYASRVNIPAQGVWKLTATIGSKLGSAEVAGEITVLPPQPPMLKYWPYFALVPVIIVLFAINQSLKRKRKSSNQRARA